MRAAVHLYQLLDSRRGVILLGGAMTGKSTAVSCLASALSSLKALPGSASRADSGVEEAEGEGEKPDRDSDRKPPNDDVDDEAGEDDPSPRETGPAHPQEAVHCRFLNPKALGTAELLGEFNPMTKEWKDGVASAIIREFVASDNPAANQWLVFDGPIDSLWVECLNTVLDDNQMLCLPNGKDLRLGFKGLWQV